MDDNVHSPRIPGYASVKEAAEMLDLSPRTAYDYIEEGRLPSARIADVIAIPIEEIRKFKPEPSGRQRKNTPLWHISSGNNTQFMSLIAVQLHDGQRDVLLVGWEADEVPHCCCPFSTPFPQTHHAPFNAMGFPASS